MTFQKTEWNYTKYEIFWGLTFHGRNKHNIDLLVLRCENTNRTLSKQSRGVYLRPLHCSSTECCHLTCQPQRAGHSFHQPSGCWTPFVRVKKADEVLLVMTNRPHKQQLCVMSVSPDLNLLSSAGRENQKTSCIWHCYIFCITHSQLIPIFPFLTVVFLNSHNREDVQQAAASDSKRRILSHLLLPETSWLYSPPEEDTTLPYFHTLPAYKAAVFT